MDYFDITGANVILGRKFLPGEDEPGKDRVVLLSNALWRSRFGADPGVIGRQIMLDGEPHEIVGVLESGGTFDRAPRQIWKPLAFLPDNMTRDFHWFGAIGTLKAGVTLEQARAEMDMIGKRIAEQYPDSNKGWSVAVDPLAQQMVGPQIRTAVIALFSATAFVLLIGCANLANLALARGVARRREVAVRSSLGAGKWRLARQFLTENLLLSVLGGVLGVGIGYATMRAIEAALPQGMLPPEIDVRMDVNVLLFAAAVDRAHRHPVRACAGDPSHALESHGADEGRRAGHDADGRRLRACAARSSWRRSHSRSCCSWALGCCCAACSACSHVDPGFDATNVLTASLPVPNARYPDPAELNQYLDSLREAVGAVPGVRETALTSALPLQGWGYGMPYQIQSADVVDRANRRGGAFKMVTPSYFQALGIDVIAGRALEDDGHRRLAARDGRERDVRKARFPRRERDRSAHPRAGDRARQDRARCRDRVGDRRRHQGREDVVVERDRRCGDVRLDAAEPGVFHRPARARVSRSADSREGRARGDRERQQGPSDCAMCARSSRSPINRSWRIVFKPRCSLSSRAWRYCSQRSASTA